jgi:hypothetical protein
MRLILSIVISTALGFCIGYVLGVFSGLNLEPLTAAGVGSFGGLLVGLGAGVALLPYGRVTWSQIGSTAGYITLGMIGYTGLFALLGGLMGGRNGFLLGALLGAITGTLLGMYIRHIKDRYHSL